MEQEKINIASKIFDSPEKWSAFLELKAISDILSRQWYSKLYTNIKEESKGLPFGWEFKYHEELNVCQWFLSDFKDGSLSIWLEKEHFSLKVSNASLFNISKIKKEIIENPDYATLCESLPDRIENPPLDIVIRETGQFRFFDVNYSDFDMNHLAWFAGNETQEFVCQVKKKLTPLFDEKATALIYKLNKDNKLS